MLALIGMYQLLTLSSLSQKECEVMDVQWLDCLDTTVAHSAVERVPIKARHGSILLILESYSSEEGMHCG